MNTTMNLQCVHCDETHQINLNYEDVQAWKDGTLIQDALPRCDVISRRGPA